MAELNQVRSQRAALSLLVTLTTALGAVPAAFADDALVWVRDKGKLHAEHWQSGRDGKWSQQKALPELSLVGAAGLQTLTTTKVKVTHIDCGCARGDGDDMPEADKIPDKCKKQVEVTIPAIRRDGKLIELVQPAGSGTEEAGEFEGPTTEIYGMVGSLLLLSIHDWSYTCGAAHGNAMAKLIVWDADKGELGEWGPETERKVLGQRLGVRAAAYIRAEAGDDNTNDDANAATQVSAIRPNWTSTELSLEWLITMDWHYAGSDGVWGSYSRSKWVDGAKGVYPARWKAAAKLPDSAKGLVEQVAGAAQIRLLTPAEVKLLAGSPAPAAAPAAPGGRPPAAGK